MVAVPTTNSTFDLERLMLAWNVLGFDPGSQPKQVIKQPNVQAPSVFWTLDDHSAALATWLQ